MVAWPVVIFIGGGDGNDFTYMFVVGGDSDGSRLYAGQYSGSDLTELADGGGDGWLL